MKTKSILFCLVFALCANINTSNAQVNQQDSLALVDLYNSTNGPNWNNHTNWLTKSPVSTWYGIGVVNTRVTMIRLERNNLNGKIPSSIGNLVGLSKLHLDNNQLSGFIPSSIGNLVNLWFLYLNNNQLSGSIPSSLGNIAYLYTLYLDYNQLSGSIPSSLGNFAHLGYLELNNN